MNYIECFDLTLGKKIIEENFTNWTSGNEKIDKFIQENQLKYEGNNVLFEWIPYNEFIGIKEVKNGYKAIWKKGSLRCYPKSMAWERDSYIEVCLKYLHDSQNVTDEFSDEVKTMAGKDICYGISQNPVTKDYIFVFGGSYFDYYENLHDYICDLKNNFTNWTSGNEIIDNFIQEKQSKYKHTAVFEWIPFNNFIDIKEIEDNCLTAATWKEGTLNYSGKWIRQSYEKVCLIYLYDSQNITDEFINKVESYLKVELDSTCVCYGISQNPDTKDYILVYSYQYFYNHCKKCGNKYVSDYWCRVCQINHVKNNFNNFTNWTSGNEIIDNFIREKQLKYDGGTVFEWISYNKFIEIKKINGRDGLAKAIWKDGFLHYVKSDEEWTRNSYQKVCLKYLCDSRNITDEFINKVDINECYGISQNPDTMDYILVHYFTEYCEKCGNKCENRERCIPCQINYLKNNFTNWTSGNEKIDNYIQEIQLKYDGFGEVFEWIPYNEFINVKEIRNNYLIGAIWKSGPLHYDTNEKGWVRTSYEKVALKYLHNSQHIVEEIIKKVKTINYYGISQNPVTNDYVLVFSNYYYEHHCEKCGKEHKFKTNDFEYWCKSCQINHLKNNFINWTSGNEKINNLIQNTQLKIDSSDDIIFEWIPYDKFINVNETGKSGISTAIWKEGSLHYSKTNKIYKRKLNEKVVLIYLNSSRKIINNEFINEVKYLIKESYGISQDPNTNDFILVSQGKYYCEKCGKKYESEFEINNKSCPCQTSHENKKINDLIQEMRLSNNYKTRIRDTIFEWVSYDQFYDIKEIGKGGYSTVYSAIWKDGLLCHNRDKWRISKQQNENDYEWERRPNAKVVLKCLRNSKNFLDEFINKVKIYSNRSTENILKIYGISQSPDTNDYIMVLEYAECGTFNNYLVKNYERFDWLKGLKALANIIDGLNGIHENHIIHCNFHIGNILFTKRDSGPDDDDDDDFLNSYNKDHYKAYITDIGLCRKIEDIDKTNIYGVMPYVAPEVLKGKHYTQAADIYSFGMIMYFVATGKQPFANCAHDKSLILNICSGVRPELNEKITPKCYIDLMKKCWNLDPNNRPSSVEIKKLIDLFYDSLFHGYSEHYEIVEQFKQTQEHRKENLLAIENNKLITHPQAIYTSRLLNPFISE